MFKKALAHQSNATPIRSSARRQLVTAIFAQYPSFLGSSQAQDGAAEGDEGLSEKELGKLIVPEAVRVVTMETSGGIEGTLYLNAEGDPLWMSFGRNSKEYIPTLNLLALSLPQPPLPVLQIHHPLPPPILTGAPLFVPALRNISKPYLIPDAPEGTIVAFVTSEDNSLEVSYVGVGRVVAQGGVRGAVERRIRNIREDREVDEGRFCDILCIIDDHLWELGSKPKLETFTLTYPPKALAPPPQAEAGPSRPRTPTTDEAAAAVDGLTLQGENENAAPGQGPQVHLSPSDISTLLSSALVQTLSDDAYANLPSFPIPASLLYSAHILPNRPAYIPKAQRDEVVIGKSEWKKLAKWMKEASKDGLIKIKESKGEVIVQSFDAKHPSVQNHAPFLTIGEDDAKAAKKAAREAAAVNREGSGSTGGGAIGGVGKGKSKELAIEELWKPSSGAISFWEVAGIEKNSLNPTGALKATVEGYITKNNLVDPKDHRLILLDNVLGPAVGVKRPHPGETMTRDDILKKLRAGVAWSVSVGGVVRKGAMQPILMAVKTRQGRKTVTLVSGLETFGIDIDDFAEELRKLCAGSASVQPLSGSSPKLNLKEIMVQGSQTKIITEALLAKGIPKRWIKEGEGEKKKK